MQAAPIEAPKPTPKVNPKPTPSEPLHPIDQSINTFTLTPSPQSEDVQSHSQENCVKIEQVITSDVRSKIDTFYSDMQSSTVKMEDTQSPEQIMIKLRKKVCRKIFQILIKELNFGIMDSQELVVNFEAAIYSVFPQDNTKYLFAVKTICNKVRVNIDYDSQRLFQSRPLRSFQKPRLSKYVSPIFNARSFHRQAPSLNTTAS